MAKFIFYTKEGFTQAPDGNDIENCQLLGLAYGNDKHEALKNLINENRWIIERKYNIGDAICKELSSTSSSEAKLSFLTNLLDEHQLKKYINWLKSNE